MGQANNKRTTGSEDSVTTEDKNSKRTLAGSIYMHSAKPATYTFVVHRGSCALVSIRKNNLCDFLKIYSYE